MIHSRADQIIPLDPAEKVVEKLKKGDVDIRFTVIDGITHYR